MKAVSVNRASSKGIAIGKAFLVKKADLTPSAYKITHDGIGKEIGKFEQVLIQTADQVEKLAADSEIFAGHLMLVRDAVLKDAVIGKIKEQKNAEQALSEAIAEYVSIFESMDDEYMRERSADIKDIGNRIFRNIKGIEDKAFSDIKERVIVIADEISPSDTTAMDFNNILGFITESGGFTSHVSIIARNKGIPAMVGVTGILKEIKNGDMIIMDAVSGTIIIDPDDDEIIKYEAFKEEFLQGQKKLEEISRLPGITMDGKAVELCINVGNVEEIKNAKVKDIEGIGLLRSEFLYMESSHFPTEQEQFEAYKAAAELCGGDVIIRTLDIGGDKKLPYYSFEREDNPFLGWRAIRISLELQEVFKTQLRAILRASHYGKLKIMFPMIISVEELQQAKEVLEHCKQELRNENFLFNENIETGIMVETPAAVVNIEDFAKTADFFSIGTNDLTQYLLAVDRGNQKILGLYNSFHPAVLRSIHKVIQTGHKYNIKVGMCGEFASDPAAIRILLGMGLDEFSMSAKEIPAAKNIIRNSNYKEAIKLAERVLAASTIKEVMAIVQDSPNS
ncbi:phosphotransferase system enzyme I (PtsI) [Ruminiclostridium sufflavum DSM 19573]|uniref:Phosphoenolpyruvate-protein phosphotransferase n=1 Tax=Ruminiclostridium sufflavum DSM 19573 TaxID=1121337 RepID=A0A318XP86_9FIRM|nr:phosphoenolpyruvate--protein phosphotransferase [Ruminiclostridium sufflavum]PYG87922.1 phosphotransferase system enzyme I (PtsI) [Ruminiclostridium sufflavum DSM 19573]